MKTLELHYDNVYYAINFMVEHQTIKAGFHQNRNEIWSRFKRELLRLERVWNTFRQLIPSKESPRLVGDCLVSVLILYFKFQFSKSIKSSTFHIFLNLTYPLRKDISFPKCSEITQKFTQNRKTLIYALNGEIWRCLKREQDIGRKAMLIKWRHQNSLQVYPRV